MTKYLLMHDCPPGGCTVYWLPPMVKMTGFGLNVILPPGMKNRIEVEFPGKFSFDIEQETVDTDWWPPITFPWEIA